MLCHSLQCYHCLFLFQDEDEDDEDEDDDYEIYYNNLQVSLHVLAFSKFCFWVKYMQQYCNSWTLSHNLTCNNLTSIIESAAYSPVGSQPPTHTG